MPAVTLVVPGRLETRTGGYIYDQRVAEGLRRRGWAVTVRELAGDFPPASAADRQATAAAFARIPSGSIVLVDELAFSTIPDVVEREAERLRLVAIVHLPFAENVSIEREAAARLEALERRALRAATLVVATAPASVQTLRGYGVPAEAIVLAEPGTDAAPLAHGSSGDTIELLCAATIEPRKGQDMLVRALAAAPARNWHLTCAGSLTRHPAAASALRDIVEEHHLGDHVHLRGELDAGAMSRCYDAADLFVLPTLKETYGMAVAEALAHGVPVISTATGAIPTLVGGEAGILVAPGDETAFAGAVARVLGDAPLRQRLAAGARQARTGLPSWERTLDRIAGALEHLHE